MLKKSSAPAPNPIAHESGSFNLGGDMTVHRLGFGAMRITGKGVWGQPSDRPGALRVLRRAVELGIDFIDTADAYGPFVSEDLIAEALHPYPKGLVIATKGGFTRQGPNQWTEFGHPKYLIQCVEMSLRRLKLDRIDLYQLHRIDPKVPVAESLGVLRDLKKAGKIRHIGLSEVTVAEIKEAQKTVEIVSVQNRYNLGDRKYDDVVNFCEQEEIGFIPWFPMAAGDLVTKGRLDAIAKRHRATPSQIALAWLLHRSPVMLPIPGTSSVEHLEENTAAASLQLTDEEWRSIEL